MMKYENPVISGFYPDPSVCRVGDTYYLVCSSFQYFPGVPLFESHDLVCWKQIGHVLTRKEQLPLTGADSRGGIYAPTIRYYDGRFYMITTNCSGKGNFLVWTDDIHGEWSDPVWLSSDGIDPSLYFEGAHCYFMRNHSMQERACILQHEINPETGQQLGEEKVLWYGTGGRYLEAPHLYCIRGTYYLLAAEGGTEYGHMEVYARGTSPEGPFTTAPDNPLLTNRNIGDYQLQGVGHGDLVEDPAGNLWMVHLAFRQIAQWCTYHHIGRETCLVPVTMQPDGWLTAGDEQKISRLVIETDRLAACGVQERTHHLTFAGSEPGKQWCWLRNPLPENYDVSKWQDGILRMKGSAWTLDEDQNSNTFLGTRQTQLKGQIRVQAEVAEGEAGVTIYMDQRNHYDLMLRRKEDQLLLALRKKIGDMDYVAWEQEIGQGAEPVVLEITAEPDKYYFYAQKGKERYELGTGETRLLSSEVAGGFTGVMIGLFAQKCEKWATFREFQYDAERTAGW